jgi:hypothetical protein
MKILVVLFLAVISFSGNAILTMNAQCNFNQAYGECRVVNNTPTPLRCRLTIYGRTYSGATFTGFEHAFLYPGQYAYAYVYANNPAIDPLSNVYGTATCRQ